MKRSEFLGVIALATALSVNFIIHAQDYGGNGGGEGESGSANSTNDTSNGINIDDPDKCPPDQLSKSDWQTCCTNLDAKRRNFPDCCKYPQLVVWTWQYNLCMKQIAASGQQPQRCNVLPCCFSYMQIIDLKTVLKVGLRKPGFHYSYMLSVENNTLWSEPIQRSVDQCFGMLNQPIPKKTSKNYTSFWDCYEKIPMHLYPIIQCSYDFNYLFCPAGIWNSTLEGCDKTRNFLYNCIMGGS